MSMGKGKKAGKKATRWRVRRSTQDARPTTPGAQTEFATALQAEIWHRPYPPASVTQALGTEYGHPVPEADMRTFAGLDILLRARGWSFIREHSGPHQLTFGYPPSEVGLANLSRGLEPATTIVVVLDRFHPSDAVSNCQVEILLVGTRHGHPQLTSLADLTRYLGVIESHRPADPTPLPFLPIGHAHAGERVDRTAEIAHSHSAATGHSDDHASSHQESELLDPDSIPSPPPTSTARRATSKVSWPRSPNRNQRPAAAATTTGVRPA
ncbi:hypothetical protein [Nocardia sp. NPDC004860]|uniref:hypothetical protein n=1 Tax=Nocardia sp. NPDC004860 TaxID=3154557 RepID=UPI0033AFAEFD